MHKYVVFSQLQYLLASQCKIIIKALKSNDKDYLHCLMAPCVQSTCIFIFSFIYLMAPHCEFVVNSLQTSEVTIH